MKQELSKYLSPFFQAEVKMEVEDHRAYFWYETAGKGYYILILPKTAGYYTGYEVAVRPILDQWENLLTVTCDGWSLPAVIKKALEMVDIITVPCPH